MFFGRTGESDRPVLATWLWTGTRETDLRTEAMIARRSRVLGALRAGHGVCASFEIRVESGPAPGLSLNCRTPESARWVTRVLVPAYGRSSWARVAPPARNDMKGIEWGHRVRPWPDRFRETGDGLSATSHLLLSMTGLADGARLRWSFQPAKASWKRPDESTRPTDRPPTSEARRPADRSTGRWTMEQRPAFAPAPLFWISRASLQFPPALVENAHVCARVRTAVEGSLRSGRANGVRFSPRRRLAVGPDPWFAVSEDELGLILPDSEAPGAPPQLPSGPSWPVLPLGRSVAGAVIGPTVEPEQGRHLAVLGETGMGKSAALVAIALSAKRWGGVVLFDPLGETAQGFVRGLSADERKERLLWVSPGPNFVGINALEEIARPTTDPFRSDRRLGDLVHALRRVRSERYDSRYWGPRLEEMLTRAIAAAAALPSGTLADAHTLLATGGRTRQVVPPDAQESVRNLAERIRERPEDAEGARRLLYEVVRSPVLNRMLCERNPTHRTAEFVTPGRIVVVSGDAVVVGESVARYLLAVHLALVWSELLARPISAKTFVLLDETQWFAHESLAEMLRLARRRNVHVVVATQTVGSLPEEVGAAVWTNVSDFLAFRGSPEEARELARATRGISAEEVLALPRGHAAVLLGKGNSVAWVRAVGRPSGAELRPCDSETASGPPAVPSRAADRSVGRGDSDPQAVLAWLRSRAREAGDESPFTVALSELRGSLDPDGRAVRAAGTLLGRAGALLNSVRHDSGSVWTVDPRRIPSSPPGTPDAPPSEGAEETQPS